MIRRKRIQQVAVQLLAEFGVEEPPVPIERLAKLRHAQVRKQVIPDSTISGFLLRRGQQAIIGVNSSHLITRQRFTIAHELGHLLLHAPSQNELHVDRQFDVKFRDSRSSAGTDVDEREANLFAAEVLMPREFLTADIADMGEVDLDDNTVIDELAKRYKVSSQALLIRLTNLGYVVS